MEEKRVHKNSFDATLMEIETHSLFQLQRLHLHRTSLNHFFAELEKKNSVPELMPKKI